MTIIEALAEPITMAAIICDLGARLGIDLPPVLLVTIEDPPLAV